MNMLASDSGWGWLDLFYTIKTKANQANFDNRIIKREYQKHTQRCYTSRLITRGLGSIVY